MPDYKVNSMRQSLCERLAAQDPEATTKAAHNFRGCPGPTQVNMRTMFLAAQGRPSSPRALGGQKLVQKKLGARWHTTRITIYNRAGVSRGRVHGAPQFQERGGHASPIVDDIGLPRDGHATGRICHIAHVYV